MKVFLISIVTLTLLTASCTPPATPLVIGHRGAKGHVAENTLPSIKKAMDLGVDGIEIDVFRCASGELVVFHDKTLEKLTNASGYVEDLTLDSLRKVKVLGNFNIPTLQEALDLISAKVFLNIELKGTQTAVLTHELLTPYLESGQWTTDKLMISSFNWEELELFYDVNKEIPIAVLTEADPLDAIPVAKQLQAKAINPNFRALNQKNVNKIKSENLRIYPWTVNNPADIQNMIELGVDGIITDFPERVLNP